MEYVLIAVVAWLFWPRGAAKTDPKKIVVIGEVKKTPAQVLQPLVSGTPRPNHFFQMILNGPNAGGGAGLLAQALNSLVQGRGLDPQLRLAYLDEMTRGWNAQFYSRNSPTTSWPASYNFRGINIGPAWLPRHANAVAEIGAGHMPLRTIGPGGGELPDAGASSYGLLWLPELDEDALQAGAVVVKPRADGSDPYMPPRELLELLS